MFDDTLRSEPSHLGSGRGGVEGRAELTWVAARGATRLGHHYHSDPLRFLFPRTEAGQPQTAVLVTTSGGLVGGDQLDIEISSEPGASGLVMTQAAEKVYRSAGPETRINVTFNAAEASRLEWLPHETIVFDGARLNRRTRLNVAADAQAIAGEILVFGRKASGETLNSGAVRDAWEVRRDGRLVWADAFQVNDDWPRVSGAVAGLNGANAMATIVCAAPCPEPARDAVRARIGDHQSTALQAGASVVAGLVVVRILAADARALRRTFADAWGALRTATGDYGAALPRLWHM